MAETSRRYSAASQRQVKEFLEAIAAQFAQRGPEFFDSLLQAAEEGMYKDSRRCRAYRAAVSDPDSGVDVDAMEKESALLEIVAHNLRLKEEINTSSLRSRETYLRGELKDLEERITHRQKVRDTLDAEIERRKAHLLELERGHRRAQVADLESAKKVLQHRENLSKSNPA